MYLKRKIDEYLLEWKKNEERLPFCFFYLPLKGWEPEILSCLGCWHSFFRKMRCQSLPLHFLPVPPLLEGGCLSGHGNEKKFISERRH